MGVVPATFEEIQEFLIEQERIITKSLKNDSTLQRAIKKNKIDIDNETLDTIIKKVNKQMKRKYRMLWFTRQLRFQISQQIIQIERGNEGDKMKKIDNVNNILKIFQDSESEDIGGRILDLIRELPDSNLLETNNVDMIEAYDDVREKLINDIRRWNKLRKSVDNLKEINARVENLRKSLDKDNKLEKEKKEEIHQEMEKMKTLVDNKTPV